MKNLKIILFFSALVFVACTEFQHGPDSSDTSKPEAVKNIVVTPINGGFDVSYDLPSSKNILYVKIVSTRKGVETEVKTSLFNNKLQILGYNNLDKQDIKLYAVSRAGVLSDATVISSSPLISPLKLVASSLNIAGHFGGAKFTWKNDLQQKMVVELLSKNTKGKLAVLKTIYTSQKIGVANLRGFTEAKPTLFASVVKDSYGNISDTIYPNTPDKLVTPLIEERLNKKLFTKLVFDNDDNWEIWEGRYPDAFDDNPLSIIHNKGDHTLPAIYSVDLGVNVKLSRFVLQERRDWADLNLASRSMRIAYDHGQPKTYTLYGSKTNPGPDGNLANWIKLGDVESKKPSGLPYGQYTEDDVNLYLNGEEFEFDVPTEIRYFRLACNTSWDGGAFFGIAELTFFGTIVK